MCPAGFGVRRTEHALVEGERFAEKRQRAVRPRRLQVYLGQSAQAAGHLRLQRSINPDPQPNGLAGARLRSIEAVGGIVEVGDLVERA